MNLSDDTRAGSDLITVHNSETHRMTRPSVLHRIQKLLFTDGGLPLIWIVLTCLALFPVWHQRVLPMLDTPIHLALVRGWHDYHDPSSRIAEFFEVRVRVVPYFLFYGSIHLLLYVFSIEIANKIFLSAYLVLFPLSVLALARALGRSPWLALFAFPLVFNQSWIHGFTSHLMSAAFMQFALAALIRYMDKERLRYAVALGVCCILSYLFHILPWFLFGLCSIGILCLYWQRWRTCVAAGVAMLPSVLMAVIAILDERRHQSFVKNGGFDADFLSIQQLVLSFDNWVMDLFPGKFDTAMFGILGATLIGLWIWTVIRPAAPPEPMPSRVLKISLIVLSLAYALLPFNIDSPVSWWYVSPRVSSFIMVLAVLVPRLHLRGLQRLSLLPVILVAIALPLKLTVLYEDFSARNTPALRLIEETPWGSLTLVVVRNMKDEPGSSGDPATSGPAYWGYTAWPMALKGGYAPSLFDQGIPIYPKAELITPPWYAMDAFEFGQAPGYEYYVVRDATANMDRNPSVTLIKRIANWSLYKRESR